MPADLRRGTCSPRRIIDPYVSHYFAVPLACFAYSVCRFCLRVLAGGLLSALASALVLGGLVAPTLQPASRLIPDSGLTHRLWQEPHRGHRSGGGLRTPSR